jgi:tetratricopeptide (TPR) repeat protein
MLLSVPADGRQPPAAHKDEQVTSRIGTFGQQPGDRLQQAFALISRHEFGRAQQLARQILSAQPLNPDANYALACALSGDLRQAEAIPYFRNALRARPNDAQYLVGYGRALLELDNVLAAEPVLNKAMALDGKLFLAPWSLGTFYASISRPDLAEASFRKAMRPGIPEKVRLGIHSEWLFTLTTTGKFAQAEKELRDRIGNGTAGPSQIAMLGGLGQFGSDSPEYALTERELQRPDLNTHDRYQLLHSKAKMLENSGRLAESYETLAKAKLLQGARYDPAAMSAFVDHYITHFGRDRLQALQQRYGTSDFAPVYVVGMPRSGTTLCEQILSSHSKVGGAGELKFIPTVAGQLGGGDLQAALQKLGADRVAGLADYIARSMRFLSPGHDRIVDKMPHNFRFLFLIGILFPKARIVHCFRDPADNFLSAFQNAMSAIHNYSFSPDAYADYYQHYVRLMKHWYAVMGESIFPLRYESLVTDPRPVIASLLEFLGLEWEEDCLHPEDNASKVKTFSLMQVRSPISPKSIGRWKRYAELLEPLHHQFEGESGSFP